MVALAIGAMTLFGMPAAADGHLEVVADGLDNPRGLDVGPAGRLYVAEAGRGGELLVEARLGPNDVDLCVGLTGSITEIHRGKQHSLVALPSVAEADEEGGCDETGLGATGPHDVSLTGKGTLSTVIGLGGDVDARDDVAEAFPAARMLGTAQRVLPNGRTERIRDLAAFEQANDPDGEGPDSNPYGIEIDGGGRLVADAGANAVLRLTPKGRTDVVAVLAPQCVAWSAPFPNPIPDAGNPCGSSERFPAQAVPTAAVVGPDGAYYVSELTGFPFTQGAARIWRVEAGRSDPATCSTFAPVPNDGCEVYAEGLTSLVDLAFGDDRTLYAVQFADEGVLAAETGGSLAGSVRAVAPGGGSHTAAVEGLTVPGGIAVDGSTLYITNNSLFPATGQVVRTQVP